MAIHGCVCFFILCAVESGCWHRIVWLLKKHRQDDNTQQRQQDAEDDDVAAERERIVRTPVAQLANTDTVVLRQLTKIYDINFLAVDRLSVGVPRGECFGLLGVNGAGKTTTFAMLTGETSVSSGDAFLGGLSVVRGVAGARRRLVGFCPQFDALIDQMTVRETLWMYARLRGIHGGDIGRVVEKLIEQLTLQEHANKGAGKLRYTRIHRDHSRFDLLRTNIKSARNT